VKVFAGKLLRVSVVVAFVLFLSALPSVHATTLGSAIRISTNAYLSSDPSVAAVGSYVYLAWDDYTPVPGSGGSYCVPSSLANCYAEIWMRVSSNGGASYGSSIRITTNTGDSLNPSVAASGTHVYVAWMDNTPVSGSGTASEIWLRVSSNNGASFGPAVRISTNTGHSFYPSVAAIGSWVYVAWQDDTAVTGSGGYSEIWMRVSSNNGASFGSPIRITTNTGKSERPSVAADGSGHVYVAWHDFTPVSGSSDNPEVWMRVSSNNGVSFGSAIRITTNTGTSDYPSVAAYGSYVYVAWQDDTPVTGSGSAPEIWTRVSSNYGASFGSPIRITTNTGSSGSPSVAAGAEFDLFYVAWNDNTPVSGSGTASEIWVRVGR
jgi:hypothetical protein